MMRSLVRPLHDVSSRLINDDDALLIQAGRFLRKLFNKVGVFLIGDARG
jgi:hypothetical protein